MHPALKLLTCLTLTTLCARAPAGIEDRDNHAPTAAGWAANINLATMTAIINQGYRIVDLEVTATSPSTLVTISYVANTGPFQKGWWWAVNQTPASLTNLINTNKARLIDLEVYNTSSGLRFAALMESNTGSNAKGWWWFYGTTSTYIFNQARTLGARVVDLERYWDGSAYRYAALLLHNSGSDYKPTWYYTNQSLSTISNSMRSNGARLWDMDRYGSSTYNAVAVKSAGEKWFHYYGLTGTEVTNTMMQLGCRAIDIEQYGSGSSTRYNVVLVNNVNALSRRVGDLMRGKSDGYMGTFLQRVTALSKVTLADINGSRRFEPASTLKALHLVRAMRDVMWGNLSMSSRLQVTTGTNSNNSCPYAVPSYSLPLKDIAEGMMRASNNAFTKVFTDRYGMSGLNSQAGSLGMSNTKINHHIGCGTPANYTTLVDMAKLYGAVIRGYLGTAEDEFLDTHGQSFYGGYYAEGYLRPVIDQEAAKVGLTTAQRTSFVSNMMVRGKKGGYGVSLGFHRAWAGYVRLPIWVNGGMSYREYATGAFVNNASNEPKAIDAAATGAAEVLRDEIHAAMLTLKNHVFGATSSFGSSCKGSLATPFVQSITGTPELGQNITYQARATRRSSNPAMFYIGVSKSYWNRVPLPIDLNVLGAPGCDINVSLDLAFPMSTRAGLVQVPVKLPTTRSLIGRTVYTQFLIADPGANAAGLTSTNGMSTFVGGQK